MVNGQFARIYFWAKGPWFSQPRATPWGLCHLHIHIISAQRANRSSTCHSERLVRWTDHNSIHNKRRGVHRIPRALPWAGRTGAPLGQRTLHDAPKEHRQGKSDETLHRTYMSLLRVLSQRSPVLASRKLHRPYSSHTRLALRLAFCAGFKCAHNPLGSPFGYLEGSVVSKGP
jgi:hypothetical protein